MKGASPKSMSFKPNGYLSMKLLGGFWVMYVLFCGDIYFCNLRAHLISLQHEAVVDTLQDLVSAS